MLAYFLIFISLVLLYLSDSAHRKICAIFSAGIILDEASFRVTSLMFDSLCYYPYITYAFIEAIVLYNLRYKLKHNPTFILLFLTAINMLYNVCTALCWTPLVSNDFYNAFEYFVGAVVIFQLIIIWNMLNDSRNADRFRDRGIGDVSDWIFRVQLRSACRVFGRKIS